MEAARSQLSSLKRRVEVIENNLVGLRTLFMGVLFTQVVGLIFMGILLMRAFNVQVTTTDNGQSTVVTPTALAPPQSPSRIVGTVESEAPTPDPEPAKVKQATPSSASTLSKQGWSAVDRGDLTTAASRFQAALNRTPGNAEANLGYGYVLLQQGNGAAAAGYLCSARSSGGTDIQREASGFLDSNGLTCP